MRSPWPLDFVRPAPGVGHLEMSGKHEFLCSIYEHCFMMVMMMMMMMMMMAVVVMMVMLLMIMMTLAVIIVNTMIYIVHMNESY